MTRLQMTVEIRSTRIPTDWTVQIDQRTGERFAVPIVSKNIVETKPAKLDAWELRGQFLRMKHDEASALSFLRQVGVWEATAEAGQGTRLTVALGSRHFSGRALFVGLDEWDPLSFWKEQQWWRKLLCSPSDLRTLFGSPPTANAGPIAQLQFAVSTRFFNEIPLHIEWRRGHPYGVIETITGQEMLIATTQLDLLRGVSFGICKRDDCATPFPVARRGKQYCCWYCAHIVAVRKARAKK